MRTGEPIYPSTLYLMLGNQGSRKGYARVSPKARTVGGRQRSRRREERTETLALNREAN
jgi:hypothetical protein